MLKSVFSVSFYLALVKLPLLLILSGKGPFLGMPGSLCKEGMFKMWDKWKQLGKEVKTMQFPDTLALQVTNSEMWPL